MAGQPTYRELAEAIAHCVYERLNLPEPAPGGGWKNTVDNMSSSAYQIPTEVLHRLGILAPLDQIARRYAFTCAPEEFGQRIERASGKTPSEDALVLALICLLELFPEDKNVRGCLTGIGVCADEPAPAIKWTGKKQHYDELLNNWPALFES